MEGDVFIQCYANLAETTHLPGNVTGLNLLNDCSYHYVVNLSYIYGDQSY